MRELATEHFRGSMERAGAGGVLPALSLAPDVRHWKAVIRLSIEGDLDTARIEVGEGVSVPRHVLKILARRQGLAAPDLETKTAVAAAALQLGWVTLRTSFSSSSSSWTSGRRNRTPCGHASGASRRRCSTRAVALGGRDGVGDRRCEQLQSKLFSSFGRVGANRSAAQERMPIMASLPGSVPSRLLSVNRRQPCTTF